MGIISYPQHTIVSIFKKNKKFYLVGIIFLLSLALSIKNNNIMSATIYQVPDGIKAPNPFEDRANYDEREKLYIKQVQALAKERTKDDCKECGKVIRFQVADGYAEYVVMSLKPVELIHLEHMDAYQFQYVDLMTAEKIREIIKKQEALNKLFGK
jgi:hypothetical protein